MQEFAISTGASRQARTWKTEQWQLEDFINRLRQPVITAETMVEYAGMSKDEKDGRKDVGGYVAGALRDKKRGSGHVQWRSLVTLDLDNVDAKEAAALETIRTRCPYFFIVHPTHSHRPEAPRLRLIIPLENTVPEEQYEPLARRLAADINIDWFDPTTFQASRLMFWPSIPRDLDYDVVFTVHEGPFCAPNAVLARYTDWRNIGEWPGSASESEAVGHRAKLQQNPREKHGPVGVFCRAYSIEDAIATFLADVYTPTEKAGRYTYAQGSTVGGLVLYDGLFAFDNHATSPASGQLCNAFDLVRLHRFGALDVGSRAKMPDKLPSYAAMVEMMEKDARVKRQQAEDLRERQAAVETEFAFEDAPAEGDWREKLAFDKNGVVAKTINNIALILENDAALKGKIFEDVFAYRLAVEGALPWDGEQSYRDWSDVDDACLRGYLERQYAIHQKDKTYDALSLVSHKEKRHPIREYLAATPDWDGVARLETLLIDYLGAADTPYVRAVTKTHLVAAVARVMVPGVKYDTMITLSGPQGVGKSTFIRVLCGNKWFSDSLRDFTGNKSFEQLQGKWMIEVAELAAYRKAEKEDFKAFISKTHDDYRQVYLRRTTQYPRQCIFWGTTNDAQFLRDVTGERRSWPVAVGLVPMLKDVHRDLAEERDQIWAEALAAWRAKCPLILSAELEAAANAERANFQEEDARVMAIEEYLETPLPLDWKNLSLEERIDWLDFGAATSRQETTVRSQVTALEVWCECFHKSMNDFPKRDNSEINNILNNMPGWSRGGRARPGEKAYGRKRPAVSFVRKC
ncbi:MAG: virulence-associated E family protein [Peptococcaceae bacterium]|nr:virulence-associated E family protein [Peptococcaceae bacterium]